MEPLDPEALKHQQWARLVALVRAALPANRFLGARYARAGLADARDLATWDDFRRLPLTAKRELVEDQAAHPPFGTNLSFPLDRYVRVHQTSGTTGTPLRWLDTQESWDWWARCWTVVLHAAGLGPGEAGVDAVGRGPEVALPGGEVGRGRGGTPCRRRRRPRRARWGARADRRLHLVR